MKVIHDAAAVAIVLLFALLLFLPTIIHAGIASAQAMGAN